MFEERAWVRSYFCIQINTIFSTLFIPRLRKWNRKHTFEVCSALYSINIWSEKPIFMWFVHIDEIVYGSPWHLPKISWLKEHSHRYTSAEIAPYQHLLSQHGLHSSSHGVWADLETLPLRTVLVPVPCQVFCAQPTTNVGFQQHLAAPSAPHQHPKGDLTPVGWKLRRHIQREEERK